MDFEFDDATALEILAVVDFRGGSTTGWDINGNANGGYLLALIAAAMRITSSRPDPISVTGHFMAPGRPGRYRPRHGPDQIWAPVGHRLRNDARR